MVKNDRENLVFLWSIVKQHERHLKFTDWKEIAQEQGMTKDHAARMRFFRLRRELDNKLSSIPQSSSRATSERATSERTASPPPRKSKDKDKDRDSGSAAKASSKPKPAKKSTAKSKRKIIEDDDVTDDDEPLYNVKRRRPGLPEDDYKPFSEDGGIPSSDRAMRARSKGIVYSGQEEEDFEEVGAPIKVEGMQRVIKVERSAPALTFDAPNVVVKKEPVSEPDVQFVKVLEPKTRIKAEPIPVHEQMIPFIQVEEPMVFVKAEPKPAQMMVPITNEDATPFIKIEPRQALPSPKLDAQNVTVKAEPEEVVPFIKTETGLMRDLEVANAADGHDNLSVKQEVVTVSSGIEGDKEEDVIWIGDSICVKTEDLEHWDRTKIGDSPATHNDSMVTRAEDPSNESINVSSTSLSQASAEAPQLCGQTIVIKAEQGADQKLLTGEFVRSSMMTDSNCSTSEVIVIQDGPEGEGYQ